MSSDDSFRSGIGKEYPLVRHAIFSPYADLYAEAYSLDQLCYHPACHHSARCWISLRRLFLF
jgi:hypothetical protein